MISCVSASDRTTMFTYDLTVVAFPSSIEQRPRYNLKAEKPYALRALHYKVAFFKFLILEHFPELCGKV